MKKIIRNVDEKRGIVQVTTVDERWYIRQSEDKITGLPSYEFVPSVTWIAEHYPKGIAFYKWLANKGWDEAEALKIAAGDKGSKVHQAVALLIDSHEIKIDAELVNPETGAAETLSLEEYEAILSFADWFKEVKPKIISREFVVWGEGYAGTVDLAFIKDNWLWLPDVKTSQYIWPSHELQVSAYSKTPEVRELVKKNNLQGVKLAILQLGYRLNKKKYKFTEIEDKYPEFLAAKVIWANEQKGISPKQKDYPLSIQL